MTRNEAIEMAAHVYGGLVECHRCHREPVEEYTASIPAGGYDDLQFGLWLLDHGWKFEWQEHDHEGGPHSGKFPFLYYPRENANSMSWSFRLTCPECAGQPVISR
jgi:hypothetical protein